MKPTKPPTDPMTFDYEGVKQLAADLGRPSSTLIALAPNNDPFYCGPARQALAHWFADQIWPLHDPEAVSVHVRRLHYLVVTQPPDRRPAKLDGMPYENTHEDWKTISEASLAARELALVEADGFVDRRAGEPTYIFVPDDEASEAKVDVTGNAIERPYLEQAPRYVPAYYAFQHRRPRWRGSRRPKATASIRRSLRSRPARALMRSIAGRSLRRR